MDDLAEIERHAWAVVEGAPVQDCVRAFCNAVGGINGLATMIDFPTGRGIADGFAEMDPALVTKLRDEFSTPEVNPFLLSLTRLPQGRVVHAARGLPDRILESRFYQEWWLKTGVRDHGGGYLLPAPDGRMIYVAFGCLGTRDWLNAEELRLAELACHGIARALRTVAAMAHGRVEATLAALEPDPCWMIGSGGAVLLANEAGRREIEAGRVARRRGAGLALLDAAADSRLRALIGASLASDGPNTPLGSVVVRGPEGFARLEVEPGPRYRDACTTLLTLRPPRPMAWGVESLAGAHDLTPREAEVALAVAAGLRPEEAAATLGLAASSVRLYLKRIYAKTGTGGQGPLIAKLLRGS
jgi:DNA-binding CsgD family transcriptional regulator